MKRRVATGVGTVQVSPRFDQLDDNVEMAFGCRCQQRCHSFLGLRIDVSPRLKQEANGGKLPLQGREKEGGSIGVGFDVRALPNQELDDLVLALLCSAAQR